LIFVYSITCYKKPIDDDDDDDDDDELGGSICSDLGSTQEFKYRHFANVTSA